MVPRAPTYKKKRSAAIQRVLGVETKYFDAVKAGTVVNSSWTTGELDPAANCLGVPVQGNGTQNRDGSRILVKNLSVQGRVYRLRQSDLDDIPFSSCIQVSLVMDTQTNGAQLSAEDVYVATDPETPGRRVIANTQRFKVLRTQCFDNYCVASMADGANTASTNGMSHHFQWFINLNQPMNFIDGAGAGSVADIKDVSFHIIACSTQATVDYLEYNFRMKFIG